ncbi:MAG: aspartyl protease family protein [Phycisphaerales bacterium]|nr:MAG: aspartyl protease family protein [Phycisphaerales bacterium]
MTRIRHRNLAVRVCLIATFFVYGTLQVHAQAERAGAAATIPIELTSGKPFVQVKVNDSEPLWFIFDTGNSGGPGVEEGQARQLGLDVKITQQGQFGAGEGKEISIGQATGVTLTVGDQKLVNQTVMVLPMDHVAVVEGRSVDGILGYSFISNYVVEIDYGAGIIRLHDPNTFKYDGPGKLVPFRLFNNWVVVRCPIKLPNREPIDGAFVVDTGARGTILFNRPFVEANRLLKTMPEMPLVTIGGGMGGEARGLVGRIEHLQLGPFLLQQPIAVFSQDRTGVMASDAFSGIIGGEVLRRCKVFFDYSRQLMILEPLAKTPPPYEYDMSGLFLIAEGPDFKTFRVQSVMSGSPAADAGLKRDDIITAINDRPAQELTLEHVRSMFKQVDEEYRLDVKRGEQTLQLVIKTRKLI